MTGNSEDKLKMQFAVHYYFKLQVETFNYMNSMENRVNKPKINQNKDRGHFLEM